MGTLPFGRTGGEASEDWARRAYADLARVEGLPEAVAFRASGTPAEPAWTAEASDGRLVEIRFPEAAPSKFRYAIL